MLRHFILPLFSDGLSLIRRFTRWLRTTPRVRWSWPRTRFRPPERRDGPARLVALRFTTETGDELQIRNHGPGDAAEIAVTCLHRSTKGEERQSAGSLAYLGAGNTYVVSVRPGGAPLPSDRVPSSQPGRWVRLQWRGPAGQAGESWASATALTPLTTPLSAFPTEEAQRNG